MQPMDRRVGVCKNRVLMRAVLAGVMLDKNDMIEFMFPNKGTPPSKK